MSGTALIAGAGPTASAREETTRGAESARDVRAAFIPREDAGSARTPPRKKGELGFPAAGVALIARSLRRSLWPLVAVGLVLIALQLVLVLNAISQQEAQQLSRLAELLPDFVRRALGDLTFVMVSFQGAVTAGYFHPIVVSLVSFLGIYVASEPANDVEAGVVDLLLARPLRRHWLITRSLVLMLLIACAAPAIMAATMWVTLYLLAPADAPWPSAASVVKMSMNFAALAAVNGTLSLLVASRARRRGTAVTVAGVTAAFGYLLTGLEPTWRPAQAIGWLSPFHYYHPLYILAGRQEPWPNMLVLGVAGVLLTVAAYWQFAHRDV
jgi:ABC-2 type transport system permease protein